MTFLVWVSLLPGLGQMDPVKANWIECRSLMNGYLSGLIALYLSLKGIILIIVLSLCILNALIGALSLLRFMMVG